jgi:NADH-quinone oxidoreductase subunit L
VTHAFFKALLFLAAGSVILGLEKGQEQIHGHAEPNDHHPSFDPQDMRNMGGLRDRMPLTFWVYFIGALALSGIAPLAGFFSKDEILHAAEEGNGPVFAILLVTAFLTAFYMGRQLVMVFGGTVRTRAAGTSRENPTIITLPLIVLAVLSVVGGLINFPGSWALDKWLEHTLEGLTPAAFSPITAIISVLVALAGLGTAYLIYLVSGQILDPHSPDQLERLGFLWKGMAAKWGIDEFYHAVIVRPYHAAAGFLATTMDQGIIDNISGGLAWLMRAVADIIRRVQNGYVRSYALIVLLGVVAILTYIVVTR